MSSKKEIKVFKDRLIREILTENNQWTKERIQDQSFVWLLSMINPRYREDRRIEAYKLGIQC